jgi:hypothetical protein
MFSLDLNRALTLVLTPSSRIVEFEEGATVAVGDSAFVIVSGSGAGAANWSASHGAAPWLSLSTTAGTGTGLVTWQVDPTGLPIGTYVDTITVDAPGAVDSPRLIIDTLRILGFAVTPPARVDTALSGTIGVVDDSVLMVDIADTTSWALIHGGALWLTLRDTLGTGLGYIAWAVNPAGLLPGTYLDTVTVTTSEADTGQVFVSLVMEAPIIAAECAFDRLARSQCLGELERRYLDLAGNTDGEFNLGDFIAFLNRGSTTPPPKENR